MNYSSSAIAERHDIWVSSPSSYRGVEEKIGKGEVIHLITEFRSVFNGDYLLGVQRIGTSGSSESSEAMEQINTLQFLFSIRDQEQIEEFLVRNGDIFAILIDVYDKIRDYFQSCLVDTTLEYDRDADEDYEVLSVIIKTNASPRISLDLLKSFDFEWWLDIDCGIRSKVNIMVRPV